MDSTQLSQIWEKVLLFVEPKVIPVSFSTWFKPVVPLSLTDDTLTIEVIDTFSRDMIMNKHLQLIESALREILGKNLNVYVISANQDLETQTEDISTVNYQTANVDPLDIPSFLNPRYTFDSFVVGKSNRMAHAASLAVAEAPAKAYNPLFLYGGVGLGKTHLMHSIAHLILKNNKKSKVVYASSEKFTNELINSIRSNTNEQFRNRYRNIDVLLIDDIQFIADKEQTQEEFFHTFNTLYEANKQIIISSDRLPKEIKTLAERLRSRFECGLITDVSLPDYETRIAILKKKAESETCQISNEVFEFVAKSIVSNIRELEGALTRIIAYSSLTGREITIAMCEETLKDLFDEYSKRDITPELIIDIVANFYNISSDEIKSKKRTQNLTFPRHVAMYLSRKHTSVSQLKIGALFGRDHTTIIYACDKIEEELETDSSLQKVMSELEKKILRK